MLSCPYIPGERKGERETEGRREGGRKGVREKERETVNIFVQRKNYLRQIGPQDPRHTEPCMDMQGGDD